MVEPSSAVTASRRLVLVWRVTTHCNLSCGFCAHDRRLELPRREADPALAAALGAVLRRHAQQNQRAVHVSLLGGEPFVWGSLPSVARQLFQCGLSLGVTTNGTSLAKSSARELLLECFDELTVSIDGLAGTHDALRGWQGGFARLEESLRWLADAKRGGARGPLLRVNCVLMRDNVRQLPELCRRLASWGVEELTFNRLGGRDRPEFHQLHRLGMDELAWLSETLPDLRRESSAHGLQLRGGGAYLRRLAELEAGVPARIEDCRPGEPFVFMDELGRLAPCNFTLDGYGVPLAAVSSLDELPQRFRWQQQCGRAEACNNCQSTHLFDKFGGADGT